MEGMRIGFGFKHRLMQLGLKINNCQLELRSQFSNDCLLVECLEVSKLNCGDVCWGLTCKPN